MIKEIFTKENIKKTTTKILTGILIITPMITFATTNQIFHYFNPSIEPKEVAIQLLILTGFAIIQVTWLLYWIWVILNKEEELT